MNPNERIDCINQSGQLHAQLRESGLIDVFGDMTPPGIDSGWAKALAGGRFESLRLELNILEDSDLLMLSQVAELRHLNLKGNQLITGVTLAKIPLESGLLTLDIADTSISDGDMAHILRFPKLQIVWGHEGQFSPQFLALARQMRPDIEIKLIY